MQEPEIHNTYVDNIAHRWRKDLALGAGSDIPVDRVKRRLDLHSHPCIQLVCSPVGRLGQPLLDFLVVLPGAMFRPEGHGHFVMRRGC
jgi:hypothetical protein